MFHNFKSQAVSTSPHLRVYQLWAVATFGTCSAQAPHVTSKVISDSWCSFDSWHHLNSEERTLEKATPGRLSAMKRGMLVLAVAICWGSRAAWAQSAIPAPEGLPYPKGFEQLDCCLRGEEVQQHSCANGVCVHVAACMVDTHAGYLHIC